MSEIVKLGGIEYEASECQRCKGSGKRYDPTMADLVATRGSGEIPCPHCNGKGTVYKITKRGFRQEQERWEARQQGQGA